MTGDPYDREKRPPSPQVPPRFSLLRPLRHLAWFLLTDPTVLNGLICSALLFATITLFAGCNDACIAAARHLNGLDMVVADPTVRWAGASAATNLGFMLIRRFLCSAMHLDEPESAEWWKDRLS